MYIYIHAYTHRDRERVVHVCMSTRVYAYTYARSALARTMQHLVAGSPRLLRARAAQWARLCAKSLATQLLELRAAIPNSKACLPWAAVLEYMFVDMFRVAGATAARRPTTPSTFTAHAIRSPPPADLASVGCDIHATIEGARQRLERGVGLFWLVYMLGVRLFCVGFGAIVWSRFGQFHFSRQGVC